ncbi:amino acid permease [Thiotrichales bacterium 19S3-7]|nr:amino acid permease [Thiotrichales bacterium 19S3-7]MCF6802728.1 amino acid permease [Thiotrichales bacterium 19S3-11]
MSINRSVTPYKEVLARKLNIFHLTAFGMNYIMPFAPAIIFGIIAEETGTTVALPYFLALIVMSFTANSYIYMVKRNPVAGSLYSYVESIFGRRAGFIAGWILFLDYILIPTVVAISATLYLQHYFPEIPYYVILPAYVLITGLLNLFGISIVANVGLILLIFMEVLLIICLNLFGHHALNNGASLFSMMPFEFNSYHALFTATTLCVLSYLGYDAISTLAEEAKKPTKDVPRAIIFSVIFSATMMFLLGYLGVLASPNITQNIHNTDWVNSALFYIVRASSNEYFTAIFTASVILCMAVFNIVSTTAGARLLFGMGRDRVISRSIFGQVNKKFKTPHYNILLIMLIELILGLSLTLDSIVNFVNFGAILGFCILNFAVFYRILTKEKRTQKQSKVIRFIKLLIPFLGVISMIILIVMMEKTTLIVGFIWTGIGIIYLFFNKYLKPQTKVHDHMVVNKNLIDQNNVTIFTPKTIDDFKLLKRCWDYDHWNISDTLLSSIMQTNRESLILIKQDQDLIGSIVAYNYDDDFGYFGLFYVRSEFRGDNFGAYLTGHALAKWANRKVACDAVLSQIDKYQRIGFQPIYENRRYVFTPHQSMLVNDNAHSNITLASNYDLEAIIDYDSNHFYVKRIALLTTWLSINKNHSYVYIKNGQIAGLISISPAYEAYRIGPFYAETIEIAQQLLLKVASEYIDQLIHIDIPIINKNTVQLIEQFSMLETPMKFVRMHKGLLKVNNIDKVYGHLSIELG